MHFSAIAALAPCWYASPVDPHVLLVHSGSPRGAFGTPDRLTSRKNHYFWSHPISFEFTHPEPLPDFLDMKWAGIGVGFQGCNRMVCIPFGNRR
jgi:hypothetical protein